LAVAAVATMGMVANVDAATIKVDVTNDELNADGDCSLREAVQAARLNAETSGCAKGHGGNNRDTIELKASAYTINSSGADDANVAGDIDVTDGGPLTIAGKGPGDTSITQSGAERVFDFFTGTEVTLSDMRVSGGDVTSFDSANARGGNMRATTGARLKLANVDVTGGDAFVGGGVYASSTAHVSISKGLFESNQATGAGGSLGLSGDAEGTVKRTTFQLSDVSSSTATSEGGVIYNVGDGLKLLDSVLQGSSVETSGGGNAALGGAMYSSSELTIRGSTIRGNGVSAETDNVAEHGGGIYFAGGESLIVNSTFFGNSAGDAGDNDGVGGAIYGGPGAVKVKHVTFDSNQGTDEGDTVHGSAGIIDLFGSVIDDATDPCTGVVSSGGFNVSESIDAGCSFEQTDVVGGDPGLGSIGENGGPTPTIAIAPTSDAKNLVPKGKCKKATKNRDQRGFKRPKGPGCDSGAFELGAKKP
jgi:CSLREA domain-containing protein